MILQVISILPSSVELSKLSISEGIRRDAKKKLTQLSLCSLTDNVVDVVVAIFFHSLSAGVDTDAAHFQL